MIFNTWKHGSIIFLMLLLNACDMTPKPEKTFAISPEGLFSAALSKQFALLGTIRGNAELWQLKPKALLHTWQHTDAENGIIAVAISDDEHYALTAEKDSIAWWRIADGNLLNVWSLPDIHSVSLSADGQFALIGLPRKAIYFALNYGKTIYAFAHQQAVVSSDISASGLLAITGSEDHSAKLWDLNTGKIKSTWQHHSAVSVVAITDDDQYALTNAALGRTRLWKTHNGKLYRQIGPSLMTLSAVKFSSDNHFLITGRTSQRIDLWRIKSGKMLNFWRPKKENSWRPSASTILALTFDPTNKKFYSISSNGYLQRWRK